MDRSFLIDKFNDEFFAAPEWETSGLVLRLWHNPKSRFAEVKQIDCQDW